jgi:hypothetical protein
VARLLSGAHPGDRPRRSCYAMAQELDMDRTDQIHLIADGAEIARRRKLLRPGRLIEVWPDLARADHSQAFARRKLSNFPRSPQNANGS